MTLKNILSILSFLFIAVACSMEDDILPADSDAQTNETPEVLVSVDLAFNGITSKSASEAPVEGDKETTVSTAVIALVNANNQIMVIRNAGGQIGSVNNVKDIKFLTKVAENVKAIAIVNTKKADDYLACKTMADLNSIIEEEVDQEFLVKVGEKNDIFKGYEEGSSSTTKLETLNIEIPVTQLSARVDLMGIKYSKDSESSYINSVKFVSAQLININNNSQVYDANFGMVGKEAQNTKTEGGTKSITEGILSQDTWLGNAYGESITTSPLFTDYSYTNTSSDPVKMRITYSVNEETPKSVDIVINKGIVKAGTLYRLYVGLKIKNDKVETEVTCYTKDWIKEDIKIEI